MDDLIYKTYKFRVKSALPDGTFEGVASTISLDSDGEIVDKGAFARTLNNSNGVFPILWQHIKEAPAGWNKTAVEDDRGLCIQAQFLMNCEQGRYAHDFVTTGLAVGGKPGLSIGFQVPKGGDYVKNGIRHFKEVILREVSIVTFPANSEAVVIGTKGVVAFGDLPLAGEDVSWDGSAARTALGKWAGGPDKESINWGKYRRGFFWFDADNADQLGSYKLPFATVIDGRLMAVPGGIMAAAGGHGVGSADIPAADKDKVKSVITKYYKKMKKDSPFKGEVEGGVVGTFEFKGNDFASQLATSKALDGHYDLRWKADRALRDVIDNVCENKEMELADKKPLIHKALDGHCDFMKDWWSQLLDITNPGEEEDDEKPDEAEMEAALVLLTKGGPVTFSDKIARALNTRTRMMLAKTMGLMQESMGHSQMSKDCKKKALGHLTDLSSGRYWNDVNRPNPVGGGGGAAAAAAAATANPVGGGGKGEELLEELNKALQKICASK
jgi:HK97 family phage prohead protease